MLPPVTLVKYGCFKGKASNLPKIESGWIGGGKQSNADAKLTGGRNSSSLKYTFTLTTNMYKARNVDI